MTRTDLPPLAVQLYTLRGVGDDLVTMIPKLAGMGYEGVELFGGQLSGVDPALVVRVLDDAGMVVSSAHIGLGPDGTVDETELDRLQSVGVDTVVVAYLPPERFTDDTAITAAAAELDAAAAQVAPRGLTLGYHNHFWELQSIVDERPALLRLFELTNPAVIAEVDTYWARVGGVDPAAFVADLGDRVRLLHVKDGPGTDASEPMVAVGSGALDVPAILRANPAVRWHVVELDRCATDMYEAVAQSQRYLAGLGLSAVRAS